jgi:hypothetical protein
MLINGSESSSIISVCCVAVFSPLGRLGAEPSPEGNEGLEFKPNGNAGAVFKPVGKAGALLCGASPVGSGAAVKVLELHSNSNELDRKVEIRIRIV